MNRWSIPLRWARRAAFAIALIFDLFLIAAWVRSHVRRDDVSRAWPVAWTTQAAPLIPPNTHWHEANTFCMVSSGAGVLGVTWATTEHALTFDPAGGETLEPTWNHDVRPPSMPTPAGDHAALQAMGLGLSLERTPWQRVEIGAGGQYWNRGWQVSAACPYWILVLPVSGFLLVGMVGYLHPRQRRRQRAGLCMHCGYDLRAHRPGQCCPECGTRIPGAAFPPARPALPAWNGPVPGLQ